MNDLEDALKENVLIQFVTTPGQEWKEVERRLRGFKGGMWVPLDLASYPLFICSVCMLQAELVAKGH